MAVLLAGLPSQTCVSQQQISHDVITGAGECAANSFLKDAPHDFTGMTSSHKLWHRRGKTVPTYSPSMDMGSYVVIVNAEKVTVSGNKFNNKMYRRHTGRPGSLKEETFKKLQAVRPSQMHFIAKGQRIEYTAHCMIWGGLQHILPWEDFPEVLALHEVWSIEALLGSRVSSWTWP